MKNVPTRNVGLSLLSVPFKTHSYSQGQRMLSLEVEKPLNLGGGQYAVYAKSPPYATLAPPSYYMLFAVNEAKGVAGPAACFIFHKKCGLVSLAEEVFWASAHRDMGVWNSMLAAYLKHCRVEKALQSYPFMQKECTTLDGVSCMYGLQACGQLGRMDIASRFNLL
ncbi:hypothetical protein L7F22_020872 [Adiantum nelumboides]|nr:hypothetical protein [Adiantum nelumboides]